MVIDMQKGFLSPRSSLFVAGAPATVPACIRAIDYCRRQGIPVLFITRSYSADGSDVERARRKVWSRGGRPLSPGCAPELSAEMPAEFGEADYHIVKPRYSAFFGTELDMLLRRLSIDTLLLAGTATPNCIRATCYDALSLDYEVIVLADCTSSQTEDIQQSNLRDMVNVGAVVISSSELPEALKEGDGEND